LYAFPGYRPDAIGHTAFPSIQHMRRTDGKRCLEAVWLHIDSNNHDCTGETRTHYRSKPYRAHTKNKHALSGTNG
jgi:hypothetical protein